MRDYKYRAWITSNTIIHFTLEELVNPKSLFTIRELVIPWLREGNKPDEYIGINDINNREIYSGDVVQFKYGNIKKPRISRIAYGAVGFWVVGWINILEHYALYGRYDIKVISNIYEYSGWE